MRYWNNISIAGHSFAFDVGMFVSSLWGIETFQDSSMSDDEYYVCIQPMRYWNLVLASRLSAFQEQFVSSLWGIETLKKRIMLYMENSVPSLYPAYEVLKQIP